MHAEPLVSKTRTRPAAVPSFATPHQYLPMEHGRLAYWRVGQGPDVVFIHGWPLHSATFRHLIPALSACYTLHLIDLPGAGQSREWTGPIGIAANAVTMRRAIDMLGLGRYALLSHDSGGAVARLIAGSDPRVCGMVLGNTEIPGHHSPLVNMLALAAKMPGALTIFRALLARPAYIRSRFGFAGCFTDPAYALGEFRDLFLRPLVAQRQALAMQTRLLAGLDNDVIDRLPEIHARTRAKVRCIWGARDPFFPLAKARPMMEQFGGEKDMVVLDDARLFAHEDHAGEFLSATLEHLDRCDWS